MSLADPYLKTHRAKEHLEVLRLEIEMFRESKPYFFIREDDVVNQRHFIRFMMKKIPDRLPLSVGDICSCLRASLDQLVWCLAVSNSRGRTYPEHTHFPILTKPNSKEFRSGTKGVAADAGKIIKSLQPYNAGDDAAIRSHPLWRLNKLCNIDKHISIPVHGAAGKMRYAQTFGPGMRITAFDNKGVMSVPLSMKDYMALNPDVTFDVIFGDPYWKIECDFACIEHIYEFVANKVIPGFTRFCP